MTLGPDGGRWQGPDEPIWPGGPWDVYGPVRQGAPPIGAGGYGVAPGWGAPVPPPSPAAVGRRTYAFLIVAGALAIVVILVALVIVAVSFVRTEIRRYIVPSNGFVQPVPSASGPSGSLLTPATTTAVVNEERTVFANAVVLADPDLQEDVTEGVPQYSNPLYPMSAILFVKIKPAK